ncbi:MAG TPA: hypothetical protein VD948_11805 [Rhodothermales bacterium]|nr:hypothetical protein [Rhodothermales bacterium]
MTTGSLFFMLGSWAFVLILLIWSYSKIFAAQARRGRTPDPGDDMTLSERFPPTA